MIEMQKNVSINYLQAKNSNEFWHYFPPYFFVFVTIVKTRLLITIILIILTKSLLGRRSIESATSGVDKVFG